MGVLVKNVRTYVRSCTKIAVWIVPIGTYNCSTIVLQRQYDCTTIMICKLFVRHTVTTQ